MTADKLYGAAAAYLMLGALWAYLYAIATHLQPGSFAFGGAIVSPPIGDLLYFSFTVLTRPGFGDAVPVLRYARGLCVLEELVGALFLAILIARLAGVYPQSCPTRYEPGAGGMIPTRNEPGRGLGAAVERLKGSLPVRRVDHRIDGDRHGRSAGAHRGASAPSAGGNAVAGVPAC